MNLRLDARTSAVRDVRRRVARWAEENGAGAEVLRTVSLLTSELVTNAVEHGPRDGCITVDATVVDSRFRVAVSDESHAQPVVRERDNARVRGRGMQLVELLSSDWGVDTKAADGKCVWFVVAA
jgi:anti-sigma regulatory factor (Ser/Thr protein kinase)